MTNKLQAISGETNNMYKMSIDTMKLAKGKVRKVVAFKEFSTEAKFNTVTGRNYKIMNSTTWTI